MNRHTRTRLWAAADQLAPYLGPVLVALSSAALGACLALYFTGAPR